jgi:hypothetical protein
MIIEMRKSILFFMLTIAVSLYGYAQQTETGGTAQLLAGQWSVEKANAWYAKQKWIVGCNFVPSTAVNDVEFWQDETFDLPTIDKELGLARAWGINSVRVFLNYVVWEAEAEKLKSNFKKFLDVAKKHGISVMPVLFDDCNFSGGVANVGKQPDAGRDYCLGGWVSSPPLTMVRDESQWEKLRAYEQDMIKTFWKDKRIIVWDLYNEPGNNNSKIKPELLANIFAWAREAKPSQPLTAGAWTDFSGELSKLMRSHSDIVSFHCYSAKTDFEQKIKWAKETGRPAVCTEWLHRPSKNTVADILPLLKETETGGYLWGLVNGKTQTHAQWGSTPEKPKVGIWQHDLMHNSGAVYDSTELRLFRTLAGNYTIGRDDVLLPSAQDSNAQTEPDINPLDLQFQRLSARRFVFSPGKEYRVPLCELNLKEIVNFVSMHPPLKLNPENSESLYDETFKPVLDNPAAGRGKLCLNGESTIHVGVVNPYATYDLDIEANSGEVGFDFAQYGLRNRIQVLAVHDKGVVLRIIKDAKIVKEQVLADSTQDSSIPFSVRSGYKLRVQLAGRLVAVFAEKDGMTTYLAHLNEKDHFGDVLDFRNIETNKNCSFNIYSQSLDGGLNVIGGACSYLSMGMGQADIRAVTDESLNPVIDGDGRLWFMFSCRGIGITSDQVQGVLSMNPSVFDVRFEGIIVFDFGDGLLRSSVGTHLFYDRKAKEWRAYSCDFGGSKNREGRSESQLFWASGKKDPRRGYSVMKAELIPNSKLAGHHEAPCIFYDETAGKWRLFTSVFVGGEVGISADMFESDTWNGVWTQIAPPIDRNATGNTIQRFGKKLHCLMGGYGALRVHSYPDLKYLGDLKLDFQPNYPKPAGRVWANMIPLPEGYPYRYVLLTMDRANFTGVKGPTWSYGSFYFYGANLKD